MSALLSRTGDAHLPGTSAAIVTRVMSRCAHIAVNDRLAACCALVLVTLVAGCADPRSFKTIPGHTIQDLADSGGGCLVIEAGKTIIIEKEKFLALANRLGIAVVAR